ncbi:LacI family DNA-binding transcriptional regulator [Edaphovirga cremea]|uniref:LacI family DNA-binding transcriptional regulator n=1 Tax=Edaphovirga cremea TaxID=2267246 RepID=UPI003988A972
MKPKSATLNDVARHAGVSYQTVSRVLHNSTHVSDETRERVELAIAMLDYVPNRMAQQLAGKQTFTVGLVTTSLSFHAPSQIASAIKAHAEPLNYHVVIAIIGGTQRADIQQAINELKAQRVDGIIINAPLETADACALNSSNESTPCLFLDVEPDSGVFQIIFNPQDASTASVDYLVSLGHRDFVLLNGPLSSVSARMRQQSWISALEKQGLTPVGSVVGDWSPASGYQCTQEIIRTCPPFSAILVGNDQMALGVLSALHQQGILIPQQVSVIGYDDTQDSEFFFPALTTVSQDFSLLGKEAIERLVKRLSDGPTDENLSLILPTHLVIRHSTAACHSTQQIETHKLAAELKRIAQRLLQ